MARVHTGAVPAIPPDEAALDPNKPSDRHLIDDWLTEAEKRAGLPKLMGGLWHPHRRMWAMCRKNMPTTDVMEVGGWDDYDTFRKYQQADYGTMLRVLENAPVLRDGVELVDESGKADDKKGG